MLVTLGKAISIESPPWGLLRAVTVTPWVVAMASTMERPRPWPVLWCFPAVLFSGAILPVHLMAKVGAVLSVIVPSRWAFEAIGHDIGARHILAQGHSLLGPPLLASYGDAGSWATGLYWLILGAFIVATLVATWGLLVSNTKRASR